MSNGGKADSLIKLRLGGFLIPPFFVCDSNWPQKKILSKLDQVFPGVKYFAVRSSALNEDSKKQSFAGHYYSGLGILKKDVHSEVLKVNESFGKVDGSVIVQEFIPSDIAGVLFTQVDKDTVIINATIGLCQPVVSGRACDEYICDKSGHILSKTISKKKEINVFSENKIISKTSGSESLTEGDVKKLTQLAIRIQKFFGSPQDIEWCIKGDKLYVLQSRPITRDFAIKNKHQEFFDSANIAESYSGIVLPLTCSFAQMVYEQVYKDLLRMSGVSGTKIDRHSEIFENLLGFFYGRMYYNMNNWYLMAAFVPGYQRNKENFELMITSNIKQNISTSIKPSLNLKAMYPFILIIKVLLFGYTSGHFMKTVKKELKQLRKNDFMHLKYDESINLFRSLNRNLLRRWYVAAENDFLVMTYLGILKKLLGEKLLQEVIVFPSKATEQVDALAFLSKEMKETKSLWSAIASNNVKKFNNELLKNTKAKTQLNKYLLIFGGRFANELKLESVGVDEDTTKLFAVLRAYENYKPKEYTHPKLLKLPLAKKIVVKIVLAKFKKYASRREEFRLLRSNTFGMARSLFRQMGSLLAKQSVIQNADDVFYLRLDELLTQETIKNNNISNIIKERKKNYVSYKSVSPPAHFATTDNIKPAVVSSKKLQDKVIYAHPASNGIVKGKIKVFKEFFMPEKIDFDILVTSHTDPGWTSLIALSKGLIIEHGGVLSHASIVARELGIPAVIGAENTVNSFKDGQVVEIDGSSGIIKIL